MVNTRDGRCTRVNTLLGSCQDRSKTAQCMRFFSAGHTGKERSDCNIPVAFASSGVGANPIAPDDTAGPPAG